jgi:MoxR-like ATPase
MRPEGQAGVVSAVPAVSDPAEVSRWSAVLRRLHVADPLMRYVRELGVATRAEPRLRLGASTRALRALVRCVQVYAAAQGRHFVVPSDVQRLAEPVLAHRLLLTREATIAGVSTSEVVASVLASVPVPSPEAV